MERPLGNLRFAGSEKEMESSRNEDEILRLGEFELKPPKGITGQVFAERLKQAAKDYDGSQPYSLPPLRFDGTAPYITDPTLGAYAHEIMPRPYADNRMDPNEYNSNSFAAALLNRAGAGLGISDLQKHLAANKWAAPGLEQPLSQRYFRNR